LGKKKDNKMPELNRVAKGKGKKREKRTTWLKGWFLATSRNQSGYLDKP